MNPSIGQGEEASTRALLDAGGVEPDAGEIKIGK